MRKYLQAKQKKWFWFLVLALIGYTVKNIFVGADVDEGYGIMVGYRLAQGDRLLLEMWEPHQTSAIFTALFIKPFLWITGGQMDFLNIYLRICFFAVHGLLAYWIYRTVVVCAPQIGNITAALMAGFFYVSSPKCIYIPEYSNLQVWFTLGLILCLLWYFCENSPLKGKFWVLALAGVFLTCDVLAYPSMALLFPVCIGVIIWYSVAAERNAAKEDAAANAKAVKNKAEALKACGCFVLPCVLGALLFVGYLLSYMSIDRIIQVIPYILGDGSHQVGWSQKLLGWGQDLETIIVHLAVGGLFAAGCAAFNYVTVKKQGCVTAFVPLLFFWFIIAQVVFQVGYWCLGGDAVVCPQINYFFIPVLGIYCYKQNQKKDSPAILMIGLTFCGYLAVALLSNWGLSSLHVYLTVAVLGGFWCWNTYFTEKLGVQGQRLIWRLLFVVIICNVFGYSYRMIGGDSMSSNILEVRGINRTGVRAGILTNYMTSYRYNVNQESWEEMVPVGSKLLYVGASQYSYMMGDCVVAIPSTISTPSYNESMLAYWELNPDRYPDVVAVESMYGEITVAEPDSFIMQWLENEFLATEIVEYPYLTIYKK